MADALSSMSANTTNTLPAQTISNVIAATDTADAFDTMASTPDSTAGVGTTVQTTAGATLEKQAMAQAESAFTKGDMNTAIAWRNVAVSLDPKINPGGNITYSQYASAAAVQSAMQKDGATGADSDTITSTVSTTQQQNIGNGYVARESYINQAFASLVPTSAATADASSAGPTASVAPSMSSLVQNGTLTQQEAGDITQFKTLQGDLAKAQLTGTAAGNTALTTEFNTAWNALQTDMQGDSKLQASGFAQPLAAVAKADQTILKTPATNTDDATATPSTVGTDNTDGTDDTDDTNSVDTDASSSPSPSSDSDAADTSSSQFDASVQDALGGSVDDAVSNGTLTASEAKDVKAFSALQDKIGADETNGTATTDVALAKEYKSLTAKLTHDIKKDSNMAGVGMPIADAEGTDEQIFSGSLSSTPDSQDTSAT